MEQKGWSWGGWLEALVRNGRGWQRGMGRAADLRENGGGEFSESGGTGWRKGRETEVLRMVPGFLGV